jgi:signal peptidase I
MPILLIAIAIVVALSTRSFTAASTSMAPTLTEREFFMVSKWYFTPTRGDIVAFGLPRDPSIAYVFRLVGMPGDRIQMIRGHLHINGQPVRRTQLEDYVHEGKPVKQWRETLPNGVTHRTIDMIENGFYDNTQVYNVPKGHYFVMGDNRDNASDSRVMSQTGTIPRENLIGFAFYCRRSSCR